ncbi:MAG: sensor histidine kinase [Accumulibacter sp.]|jgi:signal transduction histidine kinase|uniref:sensor histidine kinase n=1 Tax=Accumulibacter sp. TaxID=2053492 RepID=UPI001ACF0DBF|nr:sensor histidine kinase [Accumulibacter sp.]MBN8437541.1 sensor histidine kinase [Accumulibacter sp.]
MKRWTGSAWSLFNEMRTAHPCGRRPTRYAEGAWRDQWPSVTARLPAAGETQRLRQALQLRRIALVMHNHALIEARAQAEAVVASYTELNELSHRLVTLHEHERRALAAVLHELVVPNLASVRINLRLIEDQLPRDATEELRVRIADAHALLVDTDASLRELGADLRSVVIDCAGLAPALDSYGHEFSRRTGIAFRFVCTPVTRRLSLEAESALFRIAQEALTNCAKHAEANTVTIELTHDARHALMTVTDDGIGFDPGGIDASGRRAPGLLAMRERAEFIDARWRLESHPGRGTRITVEL